MYTKLLYDYLVDCECCKYCVLRYLKPRYEELLCVEKAFEKRKLGHEKLKINDLNEKKQKLNPCVICFGLFENIDSIILKVKEDERLNNYEIDKFLSGFSLPVLLELTQLQMWLALIEKFPEHISKENTPDVPIKDAIKYIINDRLEKELKKEFDVEGILIGINFSIENEHEALSKLDEVAPELMNERNKQKKRFRTEVISRNYFCKHFTPTSIDITKFQKLIPIPPKVPTAPIKFDEIAITGPTIFLAGRYNKYSRDLSQTPWFVGGKKLSDLSVEEIIVSSILPHFKVSESSVTFMSSGREDVDVRCLGKGRPFVLEIMNTTKTILDKTLANEMEAKVCQSGVVSIRDVQLVKRDDLHAIKSGEQDKKKYYRALCTLRDNDIINEEMLVKLEINESFDIQQWTPLRVLHRRTLMKRTRTVHSVKAHAVKDKHNLIVLDFVTQAGTYIKELVHGEFGRTAPSISSLINRDIDIISLDVMNIDLDFPPSTQT
ncbi:unnamed protein product [Chironomus riparius]|uniref:tRNA pseudouridine(55) synthase n=1 Tax=Chironomus riparius TaxID=315576 RepID=A0A9N9RVA9_9DIPT|nr:unnamed protein product [Chironomus riparius]